MRVIYDLVFLIYAFFYVPIFLLKGKWDSEAGERFGRVKGPILRRFQNQDVFWVHAVSVGEVRLACQLMSRIRHRIPGMKMLLTTTTTSGRAVALKNTAPEDTVFYFPLDFSIVIRGFIDSIKPKILVLMETELWPNLICELYKRRVPVVIANGRISDRAIGRYRLIRGLLSPVLKKITLCLTQSDLHRDRFVELGLPPEKCLVAGNMKYDLPASEAIDSDRERELFVRFKSNQNGVILLAASTHAGEDEMILTAYLSAKIRYPYLKLVIAPRHIERAGSIERLIQKHSLSAVRYSVVSENGMGLGDILLIDEWGILSRLYPLCDLVFVGGSLVSKGGHNLAEVGLAGRCILHGPYMQNFKEMAREFRSANASIQVADQAELAQSLLKLVPNVKLRTQFGLGAKQVVLNNQGVTQQIVEKTLKCLKTPFAVHLS